MKRIFAFLFLLIVGLSSCHRRPEPKDLPALNGYWEIEKVKLPDGHEKLYAPGMNIDFLHFEGTAGYRMKVTPQLDGKYQSNGVKENITAQFPEGKAFLYYETGFAHWKEQLLEADPQHLVTRNDNNLKYYYKRYEPLHLN